jgi:hypothetical protein
MEEIEKEQGRISSFLADHRHYIAPVAIFGGFIADIFTLNQIDQIFDQGVLVVHLLISGFTIAMLFTTGSKFGDKIRIKEKSGILEGLMLFSFGALFSGFVIFYTRSGSLSASWPFIVIMLLLMIGTDFYKKVYKRLIFQITLYFVAVFSFMIMFIPLLLNEMGPWVFVLSGAVSVAIIYLYFLLLRWLNIKKYKQYISKAVISIGLFFIIFNVAYFTNVIPPVPLSLKFKAVYHSVEKLYPGYEATYEKNPWYSILRKRSRVFHRVGNEPVWVFATVFSPASFSTNVFHVWEYYDTENLEWTHKGEVSLTTQGGSKKGWAGFSYRQDIQDGRWRVGVETDRDQVIGYIYLRVVSVEEAPELTTERP